MQCGPCVGAELADALPGPSTSHLASRPVSEQVGCHGFDCEGHPGFDFVGCPTSDCEGRPTASAAPGLTSLAARPSTTKAAPPPTATVAPSPYVSRPAFNCEGCPSFDCLTDILAPSASLSHLPAHLRIHCRGPCQTNHCLATTEALPSPSLAASAGPLAGHMVFFIIFFYNLPRVSVG